MKSIAHKSNGGLARSPGLAACITTLVLLTFAWPARSQVQSNGQILTLTNGATVSANSAWSNDATTVITNHGTIITSENWNNSGTYSNTSLGGFELKYATTKTFTLGGTQLAQLKVNGIAGVSLPSITISNSLNLASGIVTTITPATDVITLASGATVIGGSTASYVDGIMTRKGTGDLNFPLGKASNFLPITFYSVAGTTPAVTTQVKARPAFSAGTGVSVLPSFPYAWSTTTLSASDTASYVEFQYPISLLNLSNPGPIVVRNQSGASIFNSMGAQSFTTVDPIKVKSLSTGLSGTFTVAQGLSGTLATSATALSNAGFTANWNAVSGATGYELDVSTNSNFSALVAGYNPVVVTGNSKAVTGLNPNAAYFYRVRVVGGGTSLNSNSVTVTTLLVPPTANAATITTSTGFTANWSVVTGATSYELDVSTDNFVSYVAGYQAKSVSILSDIVTGLTSGSSYQYRVRAVSGAGPSASSNTISAPTITAPPVATAATAVSTTGFTANWNAVGGATGYQLDISADNFVTYVSGFNSKSETGTSDVVTGLTINTAYKYRVRAVNAGGTSANSNSIDVTTVIAPPVAVAASVITQTGFTANWNAVTGATGYEVDVSSDGFATFVTGFSAKTETGTTSVVTGLTAGIAYKYRVRAVNGSSTSASSNLIDVTTVIATPAAPVAAAATSITSTGFTANWGAVTGAVSYRVDISTDNFVTFLAGYDSKTETGTTNVVTGLTASTAYKYRVRAVNVGGTSTNSNTIDVTTSAPPKADQTITFGAIAAKTIGDAPFALGATASSGLTVSYATGSDKITIANGQATIVKAGRETVEASQLGNGTFNAATTVARSFCINPAKPTITLSGANSETIVLTSSVAAGNQWFFNGAAITGETNVTLTLKKEGSYTVKSTVDDCVGQTSAAQVIIITGDLAKTMNEEMLLFPNPVKEKLTVQLNGFEPKPVYLMVYDLNGKTIDQLSGQGKSEVTLDVSRYATGKYILRASQLEKVAQKHFVKE